MNNLSRINRAQWLVVVIIIGLAACKLAYDQLTNAQLKETAALFVGMPAFLAIILTLTPRAESLQGITFKGISIALLSSSILANEGVICIILTAPIFYLVGGIVTYFIQRSRKNNDIVQSLVLLPILLLSLEGVFPWLTFSQSDTISADSTVKVQTLDVQQAFKQAPDLSSQPPPIFFRLGFPTPISYTQTASVQTITFDKGYMTWIITEETPNHIVFELLEDTTEIANWLEFEQATVSWHQANTLTTTVNWEVQYQRKLDPIWYFAPLQRYGVTKAAKYLLDIYLIDLQ